MPRSSSRIFKKRKRFGIHMDSSSSVESMGNSTTPEMNTSASEIKLKPHTVEYSEFLSNDSTYNEIIDVTLLSESLKKSVVCKECKSESVSIKFVRQVQGLATELSVSCESCGFTLPFLNTNCSSKNCNGSDTKVYDINTRLTYAMRCIGKGKAAANFFCGIMNLPTPPQRFNDKFNGLNDAIKNVATVTMKVAAEEAKIINGNSSDIPVAIDGTWQRRGHASLNGAVVATSVDTGKVLDVEVLSRYCKCPNKNHNDYCCANYVGNSGGMEVTGAINIFQRSESFHGLRYTKFFDRTRMYKAQYDDLQKSKEARVKRRQKKCKLEDSLADEPDNASYGAGMH